MFTVAKILTDWIIWYRNNTEDEWETWTQWQRQQNTSHYEKSDIFQYYLLKRPNFQPPDTSCLNDYHREYYIYCFGDFAALIVNPHSGGDILRYISLLLDIYDVCKGTARKVRGDPASIAFLRRVISTRNVEILYRYNFDPHCYPYNKLHAHTVAQYSLSTLLLRLLSHYLNQTIARGSYPSIAISTCKEAYDSGIFGVVANNKLRHQPVSSTPIDIVINKCKSEEIHGRSLPDNPPKRLRCKICTRICENVWGKFKSCIDCHLKRICSVCGAPAVVIASDGFPKCSDH